MIGPLLPLLDRDLRERAARKRTYVLRVLCAIGLFSVAVLMLLDANRRAAMYGPTWILGRGNDFFEVLIACAIIAVLVILPTMLAGAITREKEQGNMQLLLITSLSPLSIILGKWLGATISVLSLVLLGIPLMAIAYGFGGIERTDIQASVFLLLVCCLQAGSVALLCSSWCRSTVGSLILSYVLLMLLYFSLPLLDAFRFVRLTDDEAFIFFPMYVFADNRSVPGEMYGRSIPAIVSGVVALVLARLFLVRRAFVTPRYPIKRLFAWLDRVFFKWNERAGGVVLIKPEHDMPDARPVLWRERKRMLLSQWRFMIRFMVPVLCLGLLLLTGIASAEPHHFNELSAIVSLGVWVLLALWLLVRGAISISGDRQNGTLDVLLTTPLTGRQILGDKIAATRRGNVAFLVVLISIALIPLVIGEVDTWHRYRNDFTLSNRLGIVAAWIVMPVVLAWFGALCGLLCRNGTRATMLALGAFLAWIFVPVIAYELLLEVFGYNWRYEGALRWLVCFSPGMAVFLPLSGEWNSYPGLDPLVTVIAQWLGLAVLAFGLRALCLAQAERRMGRT